MGWPTHGYFSDSCLLPDLFGNIKKYWKNQKTDYFHCNCAIIGGSEHLRVTASFIFYIAAKGKNKEKTKHKFLIAIFH